MYSYHKGQESQSSDKAKIPADNYSFLMLLMVMKRMVGMLNDHDDVGNAKILLLLSFITSDGLQMSGDETRM